MRADVVVVLVALIHWASLSPTRGAAAERYDPRNRADVLARDVSFVEPSVYRPGQHATRLVLEVKEAVNAFGDVRLRHRSYNGGLVGPVIRVRPGTRLDIRLENHLPPEPPADDHDVNTPHGFNTTNLHTHGLHVSPKRPADDVLLEIAPCERFDFRFDIPADHPAGTFWYHAHKHGSTALQLASGMAGALIVEGGLDHVPAIRQAQEKILVLQQFVCREIAGEPAIVDPNDIYKNDVLPTTAVNGQLTPTIVMRPGEVQRWRMIHAGIEDPIHLRLDGIPLHEIAVDGLALGTRIERNEIELFPGYRSDVLIKAPAKADTYVLTTAVPDPKRSFRNRVVEATGVLKLVVAGEPLEMNLPTPEELRPYAAFTDADVPGDDELQPAARELRLANGKLFQINEHKFDPAVVNHRIRLGTAEKWVVKAVSGGHPFHVHVNPFAVRVATGGANPNRWLWRDTLFLFEGDSVELRSWFRDFGGKTVLHCHILDHEDQGMMQLIEIGNSTTAESAATPRRGGRTVPAPHWRVQTPAGGAIGQADFSGRPVLLVFHQGINCPHCAEQLARFATRKADLASAELELVAICPSLSTTPQELRIAIGFEYAIGIDPALTAFRQFGCLAADRSPRHGLVLISARGEILWESVTDSADTDVRAVVALCKRLLDADGSRRSTRDGSQ